MTDAVIYDRARQPATVESVTESAVRARLADGQVLDLDRSLVDLLDDGSYRADVTFVDLAGSVLQEVEEQLSVETAVRETGRVRARTVTETVEHAVDADGWRETVTIERTPVGREVEAVEPPREEGDVTVIPVYEEVLIVRKQLVLREEVRLTRHREPVPGPERVKLRRQRVEVERLDSDGGLRPGPPGQNNTG